MNPQNIIKPVVLVTVDLVTAITVTSVLNRAILTRMPKLGLWNESWTRKEKAIQAAKVIGIGVGCGLIAGFAGTAARSATERIFWNDLEVINPEI